MELLRRALLVGCILPGLWLLRLAPLEPLLSIVPVDFAARQREEAASIPDAAKTDAQKRRAILPLSVYVEEVLNYNVFPATGPEWDRLLQGVDDLAAGRETARDLRWRASPKPERQRATRDLFFRTDEEPLSDILDTLAAGGGTTYVSISRPGGDHHYKVDRRRWTRRDFRPGAGFVGTPAPPVSLLYPFRTLGAALVAAGVALFVLLPRSQRSPSLLGLTFKDAVAFVSGMLLFVAPLLAVGGSVQALTRWPLQALACWVLAALGVHVFAGPGRNAPDTPGAGSQGRLPVLFVREGLVFLAMALGPLAFLVSASMILWNR